ncbi:MAG: hypothetical protein ABSB15_26815 [Bryobacteraceae bacterium]|jgi:predicted nucleic acid-binding protein
MTVVISDTSPINYLILIGQIELLPALYRRVLIPDVVLSELLDEGSPTVVVAWASMLPDWAEVVITPVGASGSALDAGELAAITLAESLSGEILLLMDDSDGRAEALAGVSASPGPSAFSARRPSCGLWTWGPESRS